MTDIRRTVDEIRFLLQDEMIDLTDQLRQCSADYIQQSREANIRLRKCEEFLNQGLRAEAIHDAEIAPNLLDLVAILDFPEREQFIQLLIAYSQPRPEPLLLDVAATLNEAYALHEPIERLLDRHRLYALARSPLNQRLEVLRSLAENDATASHWDRDIREMERARFREIESDSRAAIASGDMEQLKTLAAEINNGYWLESPPPHLARDLKQKGSHLARSQAFERLEKLEVELHAALAAQNIAEGRRLRDEWVIHAKSAQLSAHDALSERAGPALAWVDDEDRREAAEKAHRRALLELEHGLDRTDLDASELQQLGHALERCGRGIPEALKLRYRNRLATLELGQMRRNRLRIGGTIGAILAIVGIVAVAVYFGLEAEKSRKILAAVDGLIDSKKLDEAQKLLDENAGRSFSEQVQVVKQKLADATRAEHERQLKLAAAIEAVKLAGDFAAEEGALKLARDLVTTVEEKLTVGKLEGDWTARRDAEVARHEREFRTQVQSVTAKLQELDGMLAKAAAADQIRKLTDQVEGELTRLRSLAPQVAREFGSQVALLESRFAAFSKAQSDVEKKSTAIARLTQLVLIHPSGMSRDTQLVEFRDSLTQFAEAFPNDPRSPGFKTAGNADVLQSVIARQQLTAKWQQLWPPERSDVETRITECDAFLKDQASSPDRPLIARYQAFLKSLKWRDAGDADSEGDVKRRLLTLFDGKLIGEGHLMRAKNGQDYYLEKEADFRKRQSVSFKFEAGFNGELKSVKDLEPDKFENLQTIAPPQSQIAERVKTTVLTVNVEGWDGYLKELALSILAAKEVDPFLRYLLLLRTLENASHGNSLLEAELKRYLADLNDNTMDLSVNWMDPTDMAAKSSRQSAVILLTRMKDLESAWKRAEAAEEKLAAELFGTTIPIGWIERSTNRQWTLHTSWSSDRKHSLVCASQPAEDGSRTWQPLGFVQGKVVTLEIPANRSPLEGTVVFATLQPAGQKMASSR